VLGETRPYKAIAIAIAMLLHADANGQWNMAKLMGALTSTFRCKFAKKWIIKLIITDPLSSFISSTILSAYE
jgi:hypothetical protein